MAPNRNGPGHLGRRALMAAAGSAMLAPGARAATPITLGYTATLNFNGAFIARDRGFFAAHGLDVTLQLITLNSNIPGAMMGGSVQVGGPTPTVLLQANDGGLDLVIVAGCSGLDADNREEALMVRKGLPIAGPADLVGRKVGVPGLNAYYHVLTRKWLADHGVDWTRVNFVEVPFTQSADVLRSGSVDVVATGQPFSTRIIADGIGSVLAPTFEMAPAGTPSLLYAATRDWVRANPAAVPAFAAAIADAVAFQSRDPDGARESAGKFIKLPPDVLRTLRLPALQASVTPAQVQFWVDVMNKQGMLQDKPDTARLLAP